MAQLFTLPFVPALNLQAEILGASQLTFYLSGTTGLATVYADEGLTAPLDNPVVADAYGRFPSIFLDDTTIYRVTLIDKNGATFGDADGLNTIATSISSVTAGLAAEILIRSTQVSGLDTRLTVAEGEISTLQTSITSGILQYDTWAHLSAAFQPWLIGTTYSKGQTAVDQNAFWAYINATPTAGHEPPTLPTLSDDYWQVLSLNPYLQTAQVPITDAGTHTDPTTGTTGTPNTGVFRWATGTSGTGWLYTAPTPAALAKPFSDLAQAWASQQSGAVDPTNFPGLLSAYQYAQRAGDVVTAAGSVGDYLLAYTGTDAEVPIITDLNNGLIASANSTTGILSFWTKGVSFNPSFSKSQADTVVSTSVEGNGENILGYEVDGATVNFPIAADESGRMILWYDASANAVKGQGLSSGSGGSGIAPPSLAPLATGDIVTSADWYGFILYGQSLAVGAQGQPPLSTTQPFANLTFGIESGNGGPKVTLNGNGYLGTNSTSMTTSMALVEDSRSGDGLTGRGETVLSSAVNGACELGALESGINPASLIFFASSAGKGGETITELRSDSALEPGQTENWFNNLRHHVAQAKAIATAAGKTYTLAVIKWMQCETDNSMSAATYKSNLGTLIDQVQAMVLSEIGQTSRVHWFLYQTPYTIAGNTHTGPSDAFLQISQERSYVHLTTPIHMYAFAVDNTHLINTSYRATGFEDARALKDLIVDQKMPGWCIPKGAVYAGNQARIRVAPAQGPLRDSAAEFGFTVQDSGFAIGSDTGLATISSISVSDAGDEIIIAFTGALGSNPFVRYARDYAGTGANSPGTNPSGTFTDSRPNTFLKGGKTYYLFSIVPNFKLPLYNVGNS